MEASIPTLRSREVNGAQSGTHPPGAAEPGGAEPGEAVRRVPEVADFADLVDEWGRQSFPASDPPANW